MKIRKRQTDREAETVCVRDGKTNGKRKLLTFHRSKYFTYSFAHGYINEKKIRLI